MGMKAHTNYRKYLGYGWTYATNKRLGKVMTRCEDYPCCGHTDGLGCDYVPNYDYIYKHAGCDHEAGYCWMDEV